MSKVAPAPADLGPDADAPAKKDPAPSDAGPDVDATGAPTLLGVWDELEASHSFFSNLFIAKDGGRSEVSALFTPSRFVWALLPIFSVIINMYYIFAHGIHTLTAMHFTTSDPDLMAKSDALILTNLLSRIFCDASARVTLDVAMTVLELSMCAFYFGELLFAIGKVAHGHKVYRWEGVAEIFWDLIPTLGCCSALSSVYFISPKVLLPALTQQSARLRTDWRNNLAPFSLFLFLRVLHAIVGLEAFVIKFSKASDDFRNGTTAFGRYLPAFALLNQLLGVVDVQKFAHKRLFIFIFGGEDSVMSLKELYVSRVWLAMLAKSMWTVSAAYRMRAMWFLAVSLSYNDDDFQKLVLNKRAPKAHANAARSHAASCAYALILRLDSSGSAGSLVGPWYAFARARAVGSAGRPTPPKAPPKAAREGGCPRLRRSGPPTRYALPSCFGVRVAVLLSAL